MDTIEESFVEEQASAIEKLAEDSDILDVVEIVDARKFLLHYDCKGLIALRGGSVREHTGFLVCCNLHEGYLRSVQPIMLLNIVAPERCWSPSVKAPHMCIGEVAPGTPLVELAMRAYELITYQSYNCLEHEALRPEACVWVRANAERFPVDPRPLRWRRTDPSVPEHGALS